MVFPGTFPFSQGFFPELFPSQDLLEVVASEALKRLSELPQARRWDGPWILNARITNSEEFKIYLMEVHGI